MAKKTWEETWGTLEEGSFWHENVSLKAIQKVLDNGGDVNAQNEYGSSPLSRSVEIDRMDLVEFFLDREINEENINLALYRAAGGGHTQIAKRLLKAGANPNYRREFPDYTRSVLGEVSSCEPEHRREFVQLLLEAGVVPTKEDIRAFRYSDDAVVQHMLRHPDLYQQKQENEVWNWIQKHPHPTVEDFLAPLGDKGDNVVTCLVRSGFRALEIAFPMQQWAVQERKSDLRKIFATVPQEPKLMETMQKFDNALITTAYYKQRREDRQRQAALSDMLSEIDDPQLRQQMEERMHKKWGLKKNSGRNE